MIDEEAIVRLARDGDVPAFARLVERGTPAVYRLCYSILRSHADAEDALQEVFVKAWRELPQLRDPAAWQHWLNRIAVRVSIDLARHNARQVRPFSLEPSIAPDPASSLARRQLIEAALMELPADDRALLVLRFYLDMELPQVAWTLGIPLGTAKSRLHRLLHRLRPIVEGAHEH